MTGVCSTAHCHGTAAPGHAYCVACRQAQEPSVVLRGPQLKRLVTMQKWTLNRQVS